MSKKPVLSVDKFQEMIDKAVITFYQIGVQRFQRALGQRNFNSVQV